MILAMLSPRIWIAAGLAVALAGSHWWAYSSGKATVQAKWEKDVALRTTQALEAERAARAKEQALVAQRQELEKTYVDQKRKAAAAAASTQSELDRLRNEIARAAGRSIPTNSATPHGTNGAAAFPQLFGECATALTEMGKEADRLKGIAGGLQDYVRNICRN